MRGFLGLLRNPVLYGDGCSLGSRRSPQLRYAVDAQLFHFVGFSLAPWRLGRNLDSGKMSFLPGSPDRSPFLGLKTMRRVAEELSKERTKVGDVEWSSLFKSGGLLLRSVTPLVLGPKTVDTARQWLITVTPVAMVTQRVDSGNGRDPPVV